MKVIIARHGQTKANVKKIAQGQGVDSLLSKAGIQQAKKLAERLKKEKIDFAYVSDLRRAVHTAREVMKFHPLAKIILTVELRERNLGIHEGKPSTNWRNAVKKSALPFHTYKPIKGESYAELQNRVGAFFDELTRKHKDDTLLIVGHGGVITMLLLKIFNKSINKKNYKKYHPDNTAVTMLEISPKKPAHIHSLNSVDHFK